MGRQTSKPQAFHGSHMKGDRLRQEATCREPHQISCQNNSGSPGFLQERNSSCEIRSWRKLLLATVKGDYKNAVIVWYTQCQPNLADRPNRGKSESLSRLKPFDVMRCLQVCGAVGKVW